MKYNLEELNILLLLIKREIAESDIRPGHFDIDILEDLETKLIKDWSEDYDEEIS